MCYVFLNNDFVSQGPSEKSQDYFVLNNLILAKSLEGNNYEILHRVFT